MYKFVLQRFWLLAFMYTLRSRLAYWKPGPCKIMLLKSNQGFFFNVKVVFLLKRSIEAVNNYNIIIFKYLIANCEGFYFMESPVIKNK